MVNKPYISLDIETTGLDWVRCGIVGIGYYSKDTQTIGFSKDISGVDLNTYQCIMHNGSFDVKVARKHGIILPYDHDTILMASLLQFTDNIKDSYKNNEELDERKLEESLALDQLALRHLNIKSSWKINWDKEKPSYDRIKEHCLMDVRVTYYLFELYKEKLEKYGLWNYYNNLLMPLQRMLVDVECTGIRLDISKLKAMKGEYEDKLGKWEAEFYNKNKEVLDIVTKYIKEDKIAKVKDGKKPETKQNRINKIMAEPLEFNVKSHVHMTKLLELKGIRLVDKEGKHTTASKLLYRHDHDPLIKQIVDFKKDNKIYKDFLCKWDEMRVDEILHTNFRLWATRTGRLSSAEPNLQQVPKESNIRELFIPREGYVFTVVDAKQLESRLAATFSKEDGLIETFKAGIDVYSQIAKDLMGLDCEVSEVKEKYPKERQVGKQLFLATIYGQGSNSLHYLLSKEHGINIDLDTCRKYKKKFNFLYSNLGKFSDKCRDEAERHSYITSWFGRKVFIPRDKSYKAINTYIQGSGSDLIGFSTMNIVANLPKSARLLLLVHDEIVIEHLPEDTELIKDLINKYLVRRINEKYDMIMDVSIATGLNWGVKS